MRKFFVVSGILFLFFLQAESQTTQFTYQGNLNSAGIPSNGNHDFEFLLFDALSGGNQLGSTIALNNVAVTNGVFTVNLNFGNQFISGANRFLEIRVRPAGQGGHTVLSPRQLISSTPYAIKSLGAFNAESATMASNSLQLGGVSASQYVVTTDPRMTDARSPTPGSASYIQNGSSQQASSSFNISSTGTANVFNAMTHYSVGGARILANSGTNNLFAGVSAGIANSTGLQNTFVGPRAGFANTTGSNNTFVGMNAGAANTTSIQNAFVGTFAGSANTTGSDNSFFGESAGKFNTIGARNAFFGRGAGLFNTVGYKNSYFGEGAGTANIEGTDNAFFGTDAGKQNTASGNSFFGSGAGSANLVGTNNSFFGFEAGLSNTLGNQNAFFGVGAGKANQTGTGNAFFGAYSGFWMNGASGNSFFGPFSGFLTTLGAANSFFGSNAGYSNTTGAFNAYFGSTAGMTNSTGSENAFFGYSAGQFTTSGENSFFGSNAGKVNSTGFSNSFFGKSAGDSNTTGSQNAFFGNFTGSANTLGAGNSFFGMNAGLSNTTGSNNVFVGRNSGSTSVSGSNNTLVGSDTSLFSTDLTYATAVGAGARASVSNSVVLGRIDGEDIVFVPGLLAPLTLFTGGGTPLCRNFGFISSCSSAARYKTNIRGFDRGLDLIRDLRPVSFEWKQDGAPDFGLVAEEVAEIEPLLTTTNDKGELEGVKYDRIGVVLVNAMKQQQAQIEALSKQLVEQNSQNQKLQQQVETLTKIVCATKLSTEICPVEVKRP